MPDFVAAGAFGGQYLQFWARRGRTAQIKAQSGFAHPKFRKLRGGDGFPFHIDTIRLVY